MESTTFDVKVNVPAAVGVPEILPVVLSSVSPEGSEPELMENVTVPRAPVTDSVLE
jgi:hypothetical protein